MLNATFGCADPTVTNPITDADSAVVALVDQYNRIMYDQLESFWHPPGHWYGALEESDNQYQEAVLFYAYMEIWYGEEGTERIGQALDFSLERLRSEEGAFLQAGVPGFMRTATFLTAAAVALRDLPFAEATRHSYLERLHPSALWLARQDFGVEVRGHFSGNQTIAALLAFSTLHSATKRPEYLDALLDTRQALMDRFIDDGPGRGYWQEAPDSWGARRLNVPYLQVQAQLLGTYLLWNPDDASMAGLFERLAAMINSVLDLQTLTLDVTRSNDFDGSYERVPVVAPSVLWLGDYLCTCFPGFGDLDEAELLKRGWANYEANVVKDNMVTLFTDSFYRIGVVREVIRARRASERIDPTAATKTPGFP